MEIASLSARVDEPLPINRAFVSVHDKAGATEFCKKLSRLGVGLYGSVGTARHLRAAGIPCTSVDEVVGKAEYAGGRVKTLHPLVYAAVLADRASESQLRELRSAGVEPFDLVCVDLYPFEEVVASPSVQVEEAVENIDIGGPSMVRAAAKNFAWVAVVTDRSQHRPVLEEMERTGGLSLSTRLALARDAFARTCKYDAAILRWIDPMVEELSQEPGHPEKGTIGQPEERRSLPRYLPLVLERQMALRYGENPHQLGAFYEISGHGSLLAGSVVTGGKELSYNNLLDLDAAWSLVNTFGEPAAVIVKHTSPCGVATADTLGEAYSAALECDPVSAFGGVVALNRRVDTDAAERISEVFTEVVAAPDFEPAALERLTKRKGLRVVKLPYGRPPFDLALKTSLGGVLVQTPDDIEDVSQWKVVSRIQPSQDQLRDLVFAWKVCAATKSNSVVIANGSKAVGVGAGDQSRVGAAERAVKQAGPRAQGGVAASEAFFPFRDGVDVLAAAGVKAIAQPGGSVRDEEVIAAADEHGMAMIFTGRRHFRHG